MALPENVTYFAPTATVDGDDTVDFLPDAQILCYPVICAPAFIWHTHADGCVNVINSYTYAHVLRRHGIPAELHVFPHGQHGLGLAESEPHVA